MRLFFLALLLSLVMAGMATAQDSPSSSPILLAANSEGGGPGGPPQGRPDGENATRPDGSGQRPSGDGHGAPGQGGPGGPPPGGSSDGQGGPGHGQGQGQGGGHAAFSQACSGKSAGNDCCVDDPRGNGQICGQCVQSQRGGLECRPARK